MKYIIATIIEVLMLIGMFVVYMDLNQGFFEKFKIKNKVLKTIIYVITTICCLLTLIFDWINI